MQICRSRAGIASPRYALARSKTCLPGRRPASRISAAPNPQAGAGRQNRTRSSCRRGRSRPNIASMVQTLATIRYARERDAEGIAEVHDAAWRQAYRGIIPGRELEKMIARRGPRWWHSAILRGSRLVVLDFDESIGGYASYGRNRVPSLSFGGEIFELYIAPEFQGIGFGKKLFAAARKDLAEHGYATFLVWALAD